MLEEYRKHVAERAAEGIAPKPLDANQMAALVELLKNPPAGEEEFLLDLLTNRVPPGVDEAAYVKAGFLAAIAKGEAKSPLLTPEKAIELLGTMQGGYNIHPLIDALDDAIGIRHAVDGALMRIGLFGQRQRDGHEIIHRGAVETGDQTAIDALDAMGRANALRVIGDRRTAVAVAFHQFMRDAAGMGEGHAIRPEAGDLFGRDSARIQPVYPEIGSPHRDRLHNGARLVGAATTINTGLLEGEGGDDGRGIAIGRAVIEVINRHRAIKQHGPLHRMQAKRLSVEIEIFLRAVRGHRQVVVSADRGHGLSSICRSARPEPGLGVCRAARPEPGLGQFGVSLAAMG